MDLSGEHPGQGVKLPGNKDKTNKNRKEKL